MQILKGIWDNFKERRIICILYNEESAIIKCNETRIRNCVKRTRNFQYKHWKHNQRNKRINGRWCKNTRKQSERVNTYGIYRPVVRK